MRRSLQPRPTSPLQKETCWSPRPIWRGLKRRGPSFWSRQPKTSWRSSKRRLSRHERTLLWQSCGCEAPIDGTVANILIEAGEQATPGAPAIVLVNEDAYHIEVSVDEIDIDEIAVGQEVEVTLDALDDTVVLGQVADIAPIAAEGGLGVVTYQVTINIDPGDVDLRPGMTANASIVVREVEEVLIVPNWAIRLDRDSGNAFVKRLRGDGSVEEVVVETGLRNEQVSEVVGGLNEGDVVVVTDEREGFNFFGGF